MKSRPAAWVVLAPAGLALGLMLPGLGDRSLWLDEGASIAIASQHGAALWSAIAHDGGNMLVYYLGLHVLIASLGDAISLLRLPSALFGVLTVGLVAALASRQLSRRAGVCTGLLAAVSLPMVFWAQDVRGYAAMTTFITASFLCFVALADAREPRRARRLMLLYVLATTAAVYCAIVAVLVIPAQLLTLAGRKGRRREALTAMAAVALACVPLLVLAAARGSGQLFWASRPSLNEFGQTLRWLTSAGMPPNFRATWAAVPLLVLSLAVLAALLLRLLVVRERSLAAWTGWLVVAWLVVPLVLDLGESLAGQPVLLTRNSLVSLPAVALGMGWVLGHPRLPALAGWTLLAVVLTLRAAVLFPSYGTSPEDWRAAVGYVLGHEGPGDCIAFYPQDGRMPFAVYVERSGGSARAPRAILPELSWSTIRPFVESYRAPALVPRTTGCSRLWLIDSHAGQRYGPPVSRLNFGRFQALEARLASRFNLVAGRSFGWAASVDVTLFRGVDRSRQR